MSIQTSGDYEERGISLLHSGRAVEALAVLEEGERKFPGDADLLMGTAIARLRMGDYAEACGILEGLRLRRPTGETLQALSEAYLSRGMQHQAVETAVAAVNGATGDAELAYRLGRTFYERGLYRQALPFYERAMAIAPNWSEAWFGLGACRWSLRQPELAETALRRAVELDPQDWQARQFLGCALCDAGRKEEAKAMLESVPLEAPWQKPALERLIAMAWWPSDPERSRALEAAWRSVNSRSPGR